MQELSEFLNYNNFNLMQSLTVTGFPFSFPKANSIVACQQT